MLCKHLFFGHNYFIAKEGQSCVANNCSLELSSILSASVPIVYFSENSKRFTYYLAHYKRRLLGFFGVSESTIPYRNQICNSLKKLRLITESNVVFKHFEAASIKELPCNVHIRFHCFRSNSFRNMRENTLASLLLCQVILNWESNSLKVGEVMLIIGAAGLPS